MQIEEIILQSEKKSKNIFDKIDEISYFNQKKVLDAFRKSKVQLSNFAPSSGYGFEDTGKYKLAEVFSEILKAEDAIVSPLIVSGTHALSMSLFGMLRPGDSILSLTGPMYDSLIDAVTKKGIGSLADYNISFDMVDFKDNKLDYIGIKNKLKKLNPTLVFIQRSCGYSTRDGLSIDNIESLVKLVKEYSKKSIIMVDNCYGTFMDTREPLEVGADIIVDSLIKNAGGGIAPTGAYIAGRKDLISMIADRMTAPGLGNEVGSYNAPYTPFFQGLFIAPNVVANALKGSVLAGAIAEELGFKTTPKSSVMPTDMIRKIEFGDKEKLIKFIQSIQKSSPVDSFVLPVPCSMPGYSDDVIMASGSFIQGSSIEMSCDAPVRPPYIAYLQGGLTYNHIKIALCEAFTSIVNKN